MIGLGKPRRSELAGDLSGGSVSAVMAIPLVMGYGMFAFGPLGDGYFAYGALAGLYAAVVAGFVCVALGERGTMLHAPRVTTTFFLGALLYYLIESAAEPLRAGSPQLIFVAFFAIILAGGAFQALFGLMRLGSVLRFTPHPVMAGLQNAAAALLFLVQLGNVSGFDHHMAFTAVPAHLDEAKPLSLAIAVITFVAMWNARAITTRLPPLLVGLGIGSMLYFALVAAGLGSHVGPTIGLPGAADSPSPVNHLDGLKSAQGLFQLLPLILGGGFALAVVAAFDALLCAKLVTPPGARKIDGDRLLVRLGLANALAACFGGITSGLNIGASLANRAFGARTAVSVLISTSILLAATVALFPIVSHLPRAVLSAAIMVIAVQHIDPWSVDLVRRVRAGRSRHRGLMILDLAVVAAVAILSVTINIVLAVFIGIAIAIALFIVRMSRSNIRRSYRCDAVRSRKARTPEESAHLEAVGAGILVLELQGVLFFGSAETLSEEIERSASPDTSTVILDLRRVTEIDATGARTLGEIRLALASRKQRLALALDNAHDVAARLAEAGVIEAIGTEHVFADVDRAIEWAEDDLLRDHARHSKGDEIPLGEVDLLSGLAAAEVAILEGYLDRARYAAGDVIFHEGDPGRELFIVARGRASARLRQASGSDIRLATFAPGTVFGELAILDAGPRSAAVTADDALDCYVLSAERFAALEDDAPAIAIKLLANLGRELSGRLRRANRTIHQLES